MPHEILNYAGIAVFASSGATVGVRKGFDLFGIATLGVLTGVGGGILRDLLLNRPPLSVHEWPNITVALIAAVIATPFARRVMRMNTKVLVLDAIGMGFFATSGGDRHRRGCELVSGRAHRDADGHRRWDAA